MRVYGKMSYTIDKDHPDAKYIKDWSEDKVYVFEDIYTFSDAYTFSDVRDYIENDLALVAGGGYNTDHIHNVSYVITKNIPKARI